MTLHASRVPRTCIRKNKVHIKFMKRLQTGYIVTQGKKVTQGECLHLNNMTSGSCVLMVGEADRGGYGSVMA